MKHFLIIIFIAVLTKSNAQVKVEFESKAGVSIALHQTNFQQTEMFSLYRFVALSYPQYTWNDYVINYDVKQYIVQPKFGFSCLLFNHRYPFMLKFGLQTSSSNITEPEVNASFGFSDKFNITDKLNFRFFSGYTFSNDWGWGTNTIINSIGNTEARKFAREFFKSNSMGKTYCSFISLSTKVQYNILKRYSIGIEPYANIDISQYKHRPGRMTNLGVTMNLTASLN